MGNFCVFQLSFVLLSPAFCLFAPPSSGGSKRCDCRSKFFGRARVWEAQTARHLSTALNKFLFDFRFSYPKFDGIPSPLLVSAVECAQTFSSISSVSDCQFLCLSSLLLLFLIFFLRLLFILILIFFPRSPLPLAPLKWPCRFAFFSSLPSVGCLLCSSEGRTETVIKSEIGRKRERTAKRLQGWIET